MKNLLIAFASTFLAFAGPAWSQESSQVAPETVADPYLALVDAMSPPGGAELAHASSMRDLRQAYENMPELLEIEGLCPGTIDLMLDTIDPIIAEYDVVEMELRREAMSTILRNEISEEHALAGAEFYSSELGQRLVMSVMENRSLSQTIGSALENLDEDLEIVSEDVEADNLKTVQQGLKAMSPEDIAAIDQMLKGEAWFVELLRVRPKMHEAGMQIANSDFAPELDAKADRVIDAALDPHFEKCGL